MRLRQPLHPHQGFSQGKECPSPSPSRGHGSPQPQCPQQGEGSDRSARSGWGTRSVSLEVLAVVFSL